MPNPIRIAVQGAPGCFSHAAALTLFPALDLISCESFPELFGAVDGGSADAAMVPVENALAGAVTENLDLLAHTRLRAVAETFVPVEMCLAVRPATGGAGGAEPGAGALSAVASHPVALQQCRSFFAAHPGVRRVVASDTAGSIRELMEGEPGWDGAIGPALAAELYGARILFRGIQDNAANYTRFLVLTKADTEGPAAVDVGLRQTLEPEALATHGLQPTGLTKLTLAFTTAHTPGSLHRAIGVLAHAGLDLTRIESRPIPGLPWEYRFHVDVRGPETGVLSEALAALAKETTDVLELGRYPELELISDGERRAGSI